MKRRHASNSTQTYCLQLCRMLYVITFIYHRKLRKALNGSGNNSLAFLLTSTGQTTPQAGNQLIWHLLIQHQEQQCPENYLNGFFPLCFSHYNSILATVTGKLTKQTRLSKLSILYAGWKWKFDYTRPCYGLIIISSYMICECYFCETNRANRTT